MTSAANNIFWLAFRHRNSSLGHVVSRPDWSSHKTSQKNKQITELCKEKVGNNWPKRREQITRSRILTGKIEEIPCENKNLMQQFY